MKILMMVHGFAPECSGGTESYVLALARELRTRGHEITIVCGSHEGAGPESTEPRADSFVHDGFPVHRIHRTGLYLDNWERSLAPEIEPLIAGILARVKPDIVHVHHWIRLSRNLIEICHDHGVPAVCTLHDAWTSCPRAFRVRDDGFCTRDQEPDHCFGCAPGAEGFDETATRQELALFRDDCRNELELARRVIVPSNAQRELAVNYAKVPAGSVRVIPHGNISTLVRLAPSPVSGARPLRLGHFGHLSFLKGLDLLLEALHFLPDPGAFSLDIYGEVVYPGERLRIEELAKGLSITWHGRYTPGDLARAPIDVVVIPSRCHESWSFVLDEAFLLGWPAIVPNRGALAERLQGAGATFAPEDSRDLARVLGNLARDPDLLESWRARIPGLPTLREHGDQIERLYREVLVPGSPLPLTPGDLRARRLRVRTAQVENIRRSLAFRDSDITNLKKDLAILDSASKLSEHYNGEKTKHIHWLDETIVRLQSERDALEKSLAATTSALDRAHHEIQRLLGDAPPRGT